MESRININSITRETNIFYIQYQHIIQKIINLDTIRTAIFSSKYIRIRIHTFDAFQRFTIELTNHVALNNHWNEIRHRENR